MIQGNHRELWVDNEFSILNNIVDGLKKEDKDVSDHYKQSAGIQLELTSEDLVLSEDKAGNKNEETTAVNKIQLVEIEDGDNDSESNSEFYGWLGNEVMNSRMEKNKTISKAAKGKKSPKRLVNRKSIRAFSKNFQVHL